MTQIADEEMYYLITVIPNDYLGNRNTIKI